MLAALAVVCWLALDGGVPPAALPVRPAALPPGPPQYTLEPVANGYRYRDQQFTAHVASDGTVTFSRRQLSPAISWIPVLPQPHPPGTKTLEGSVKEWLGRRPRTSDPPPAAPLPMPLSPTAPQRPRDPGGPASFGYPFVAVPVVLATFAFDVHETFLRAMGEDPYRREKARFLTATFDMRLKMAAKHRAKRLRDREVLVKQLESVWRDARRSAPERRGILCALWAEMEADAAGRSAAATVVAFVQQTLPAGSPDAFTQTELARCPTDAQGHRFSPYAGQ